MLTPQKRSTRIEAQSIRVGHDMLGSFEDYYEVKREVSSALAQSFWDYTAGRCLVRKGIFHPGFYCFQQSVEKLLKANLYQVDTAAKNFDKFGKLHNHGVTELFKEYLEAFPDFPGGTDYRPLIVECEQWFYTRYPRDPKLNLKQFSSEKIHEVDRIYFEILTSSNLSIRFLKDFNYFRSLEPSDVRGFEEVFAGNRQLNRAQQFLTENL